MKRHTNEHIIRALGEPLHRLFTGLDFLREKDSRNWNNLIQIDDAKSSLNQALSALPETIASQTEEIIQTGQVQTNDFQIALNKAGTTLSKYRSASGNWLFPQAEAADAARRELSAMTQVGPILRGAIAPAIERDRDRQ